MKAILQVLLMLGFIWFGGSMTLLAGEGGVISESGDQQQHLRPKTVVVRENLENGKYEYLSISREVKNDEYISRLPESLNSSVFKSITDDLLIKRIADLKGRDDIPGRYFFFYTRPYHYYYPAYYDVVRSYVYTYTPFYSVDYNGYSYRFFR